MLPSGALFTDDYLDFNAPKRSLLLFNFLKIIFRFWRQFLKSKISAKM
jgi:hypothetical protein